MGRKFKHPLPVVRALRESVRFSGVSFGKAGKPLGYSPGAAFKAIAAYERLKGLGADEREKVETEAGVGGGEESNHLPPSGRVPADTP